MLNDGKDFSGDTLTIMKREASRCHCGQLADIIVETNFFQHICPVSSVKCHDSGFNYLMGIQYCFLP